MEMSVVAALVTAIPVARDVRGHADQVIRWRMKMAQSGLSEAEAKEFHEQFKTTYTAFVAIAAVAHLLVFAWKPWF
jgi:light-harvesting complex 1 beta chain